MSDKLCKDNVICCDDNCQRCANLIYNKYVEQQAEISKLKKSNRNWRRKVQRLKVKLGLKDLEYSCLERERADDIGEWVEQFKAIKVESYQECAEWLKEEIRDSLFAYEAEQHCERIDNILREKIGDNNAK